jgi:large subunit ribosomal protein L1
VLEELMRAKPAASKGRFVRSAAVSSTMGPGVKVDPAFVHDDAEKVAATA